MKENYNININVLEMHEVLKKHPIIKEKIAYCYYNKIIAHYNYLFKIVVTYY